MLPDIVGWLCKNEALRLRVKNNPWERRNMTLLVVIGRQSDRDGSLYFIRFIAGLATLVTSNSLIKENVSINRKEILNISNITITTLESKE